MSDGGFLGQAVSWIVHGHPCIYAAETRSDLERQEVSKIKVALELTFRATFRL